MSLFRDTWATARNTYADSCIPPAPLTQQQCEWSRRHAAMRALPVWQDSVEQITARLAVVRNDSLRAVYERQLATAKSRVAALQEVLA